MDNKVTASFRLVLGNNGTVSLEGFSNGAPLMEQLAGIVNGAGIPVNTEIRVTMEPVRSRGRYSKWKVMDNAAKV